MRKLKIALHVLLALAVVSPLVFAHQVSALTWVQTYNYKKLNGTYLVKETVTPDQADAYTLQERTNNVRVSAPSANLGGNLREFFWPANSPLVLNSQTCAVWSYQSDLNVQQGAALRIAHTPTGTRGITVTKNIWYAANWVFNVHVWDTSNTQSPYTQIASFDMSEVFGDFNVGLKPLPWHLCVRVTSQTLQLKAWVSADNPTQPSWNDPKYVRSVEVPTAWVEPGQTGWYIGHLNPGQRAEFQNLQTWTGL
jgi:hypothetical protein